MSGPLGSNVMMQPAAGGGAFYDYQIQRSLRFDYADASYTTFTPSSDGDRKHFTWSLWVKWANTESLTSSVGYISTAYGTSGGSNNWNMGLVDQSGYPAALSYQHYYALNTHIQMRDSTAWYHIVTSYDLDNGTNADRMKIYVNGHGPFTGGFQSDQRSLMNANSNFSTNGTPMHLGRYRPSNGYMDGHIAEVHFLDGYVYDASYFGTRKNGVWIPKDYKTDTGNYGTNGFYLQFLQTGTSQNSSGIGADTSGQDNHHALNGIGADHISLDTPTNGAGG